jgi:non-specific serine/threonine protein kinase/serine/threonine-protein kinase
MSSDDWQRVKGILQAALDLPPAQRPGYLDQACREDADLRREVESFLQYAETESPALGVTRWNSGADEMFADPERAGPYRVLRRLGEGGMGVVYLAERDDGQYRQQVAIKVMKGGPMAAGLVRRFRKERQILAGLNHPHIARLIDGGTTAAGCLYYAMEYVDGVPVTEYCNARRLGLRPRIELFSAICLAVVHAHRKLIAHGDLKPANILVCQDGAPKVVDFGLAQIFGAGPESGEAAASTTLMMTPGYASPEQIAGGRLTIAVDVYSLGVLLCELLAGDTPYPLEGKSPFEACRAALEEDPRPPSAVARQRQTSAAAPVPATPRQLKGDLDGIVLKALRKEPDQRYGSVEELREDLERYLAGLPVHASGGARLYRLRKFVKRRRWPLAFAAAAVLAAGAATGTIWWKGRQAEMRFNDVRALAHSVIFEVHDSIQGLPGSTASRKLLVEKALEYLRKLEADSGKRRDLQLELAAAYQKIGEVQNDNALSSLGDSSAALASLQHARRLLVDIAPGRGDSEARQMLCGVDLNLADVLEQRGDESGRAAARREAAGIAQSLAARHPESRRLKASVLRIAAGNLAAVGDWKAALPAWRRAVAADQDALEQAPGDEQLRGSLATSYDGVASACKQLDQMACAIAYYRQAVAIRSRQLAVVPANTRYAMLLAYHLIDLAWAEHAAGEQWQAIADEERALMLQRQIATQDPQNLMALSEVPRRWSPEASSTAMAAIRRWRLRRCARRARSSSPSCKGTPVTHPLCSTWRGRTPNWERHIGRGPSNTAVTRRVVPTGGKQRRASSSPAGTWTR